LKKFYTCKFIPISGHQNPGFGTGSGSVSGFAIRKIAGSGSVLNQCGSRTLAVIIYLLLSV
jgi:hypothetical protein